MTAFPRAWAAGTGKQVPGQGGPLGLPLCPFILFSPLLTTARSHSARCRFHFSNNILFLNLCFFAFSTWSTEFALQEPTRRKGGLPPFHSRKRRLQNDALGDSLVIKILWTIFILLLSIATTLIERDVNNNQLSLTHSHLYLAKHRQA